jgi:hypothetical protein
MKAASKVLKEERRQVAMAEEDLFKNNKDACYVIRGDVAQFLVRQLFCSKYDVNIFNSKADKEKQQKRAVKKIQRQFADKIYPSLARFQNLGREIPSTTPRIAEIHQGFGSIFAAGILKVLSKYGYHEFTPRKS